MNLRESIRRQRWRIRNALSQIRKYCFPASPVLGRVACLGSNVFYYRRPGFLKNTVLVNQQKCRCDLLMGWIEGETRPIACQVIPHLDRSFVQPWIEEQQQLPWFSVDAKIRFQLLLMDSFAELTDQKFMHRRDGWAFCCHYSDLKHTPAFENEFESCGLLPTEEFRKVYETFFKWYFTKNPKGQVVFLHFPTKLDPRTQFKERAAVLRQVIEELVPQFPRIHSLCVPDDIVKADQANPHRYHFSPETTDTFGSQWASLPSPARVRAFFK